MKLPRFEATNVPPPVFERPEDPRQAQGIFPALAQIGEQVSDVGAAASDLLAKFREKKKRIDDTSEALGIYSRAVKEADEFEARAQIGADHKTYAQTIDAALQKIRGEGLKRSSNSDVAEIFNKHFTTYYLEHYGQALKRQNALYKDFQEATLTGFLDRSKREIVQATDPESQKSLLNESLEVIDQYKDVLPFDHVAKIRTQFRETVAGVLARHAMEADPVGFKEGGFKAFEKDAEPRLLQSLQERASNEAVRREEHKQKIRRELDEDLKKAVRRDAEAFQSELIQRLTPGADPKNRPTIQELDNKFALYYEHIPLKTQEELRKMVLDSKGGVTDPAVKGHFELAITSGDASVTQDMIIASQSLNQGDKARLVQKLTAHSKEDDISHHPQYRLGSDLIKRNLAPGLDLLGGIVKDAEMQQYSQAIAAYDQRARAAGAKPEQFVKMAEELIRNFKPEFSLALPPPVTKAPPAQSQTETPKPKKKQQGPNTGFFGTNLRPSIESKP